MGNPQTKKTFSFKAQKDFTCPMGDQLLKLIDSMTDGNLPVKILVGKKDAGKYPVYIDSAEEDNLCAKITEVMDGKSVMDDYDLEILFNTSFAVNITSRKGNEIYGTFDVAKMATGVTGGTEEVSEEAKKAMEEAIKNGYVTKADAEERLKYMKANLVDDKLIRDVFREYHENKKPVSYPSTLYFDPYLEEKKKMSQEGIIAESLRMAVNRVACLFEGPKATGKDVCLETIAWLINDPIEMMTPSLQMSPADFFGEKSTDNSAAEALDKFDTSLLVAKEFVERKITYKLNESIRKGASLDDATREAKKCLSEEDNRILQSVAEYDKTSKLAASVNIKMDNTPLVNWAINGGIFELNEANLISPNLATSIFNPLLDGHRYIFVPGRGRIVLNRNCKFFATQNVDYVGCEEQNESFLSRMCCIQFEPPKSIKGQLVNAVTADLKATGYASAKPDAKLFKQAESFYKLCQKAVNGQTISDAVLNIRGLVRAISLVVKSDSCTSLKRQIEVQVINTCPRDEKIQLMEFLDNTVNI